MAEVRRRPPRKKPAPPPPWAVYLVECGDGSLYTGIAKDLERRIATHNTGKGAAYTRSRLPVKLVWTEGATDRSAAQRREAALKRLNRREKLALVAAGADIAGPSRPRRAK